MARLWQGHLRLFVGLATSVAMLLTSCILLGCATQASSLRVYTGPWKKYTNQCSVSRTVLSQEFNAAVKKYNGFILGDSRVEAAGRYDSEAAAFDCMSIGANSVLVFERGAVGTVDVHYPGTSTTYFIPNAGEYYIMNSAGNDYSPISPAYIVVFFNKEIPDFEYKVTWDDYSAWKKQNYIKACAGCR